MANLLVGNERSRTESFGFTSLFLLHVIFTNKEVV